MAFAQELADLFGDKINKIHKSLASSAAGLKPIAWSLGPVDDSHSTLLKYKVVSKERIINLVAAAKPSALPYHPCPCFICKDSFIITKGWVTSLINASLGEGWYPRHFKSVVVTPILKKQS